MALRLRPDDKSFQLVMKEPYALAVEWQTADSCPQGLEREGRAELGGLVIEPFGGGLL